MKDEKVLFKIKELEKRIYRILLNNNCLKKNSLTCTQIQIINYILCCKNEVYQKDLENIMNLRRATISGVLNTMEKNGLIERKSSKKDTRVKQIILNDKAKNIFLEGAKFFDNLEQVITNNISQSEINQFSKIIDKMINNIERSSLDDKIV